ncbi:MAG: hypothetical protein MMC33_001354 [Icmadophila ericetorum]|nr:hypothetical protein [Icmadophila ericetorum]
MAGSSKSRDLVGLVDMGSNGIRFSITDLSPPTTRILPTLFQDRCGVSLYDAQYQSGQKGPIPDDTIKEVVAALLRFKQVCMDFDVSNSKVSIVATEATREAINSVNYRKAIEDATGWKVEMLAKEEEGRIGAMGIASSFDSVQGLVMDLGGGSVQLTWMISQNGDVTTSKLGAVSLPYGAAALTRLLAETEKEGGQALSNLQEKITKQFQQAVWQLAIPNVIVEDAKIAGGIPLYLSGGGFRGWGFILMSLHQVQPYPIPIINGFEIPGGEFVPTANIQGNIDNSTFRISARRASQVPAVSFLVNALLAALPDISKIHFAQGGLREGLLFSNLPATIRGQHPLVAATKPFAPQNVEALVPILRAALPPFKTPNSAFPFSNFLREGNDAFLLSIIHLLNYHAPLPKDIRAAAALRSTTTGILASAHGLSHEARALLGMVLCERWGAELAPTDITFQLKLQELIGTKDAWWAKYVGRAARGIGESYPAGRGGNDIERLHFEANWSRPTKGNSGITAKVGFSGGEQPDWVAGLGKLGKKKNWVGGKEGWGLEIEVVPEAMK